MKKIVIISHASGSIINFRKELIELLINRGYIVEIFAPDWTAESLFAVRNLGALTTSFHLSRTGVNIFSDGYSFFNLIYLIHRSKPDIVLTYSAKTNVWGILAAAIANVQHRVALVEGMGYAFINDLNFSFKRFLLRIILSILYRISFHFAHVVITLNKDDILDLVKYVGLKSTKSFNLGGIGIPFEYWNFEQAHLNPISFTFVGRLLREKGIFEFLNAAKLIKKINPNIQFYVLGGYDSNPGSVAPSEVNEYIRKGIIIYAGHVDVKPWLLKTSVFVLPSYREGVPRSTQEAMALGRAIITTDVPGCRETVINGVNGYIVPPRNINALCESMLKFINNPELIITMGRQSRFFAENKFNVHVVNNKFFKVLTKIDVRS